VGVFVFASVMTALVTVYLLQPLKGRERGLAMFLAAFLPLGSLVIYLILGNPDMPAHVLSGEERALRQEKNYSLLAIRPLEALIKNPRDIGALTILGDISRHLGREEEALRFYRRAAEEARTQGDPRLSLIEEKLPAP
jgi:cytochrome c-type biogenesis protein CcmH/NrfG